MSQPTQEREPVSVVHVPRYRGGHVACKRCGGICGVGKPKPRRKAKQKKARKIRR